MSQCTDQDTISQLFDFIEQSPSPYHAIEYMTRVLERNGYTRLLEGKTWELQEGGRYYVTRNGSSLAAFRIPQKDFRGFQMIASHSDSPAFKLKENPEISVEDYYVKLNIEKYGGMLCAPWLDRPLSVAGRLAVREGNRIVTKLVCVDRDFVLIPNLAVHMSRDANKGYEYNVQKDMLPLYSCETGKGTFMDQIAKAAGVQADRIAGSDLFLYNRMPGSVWGAHQEFLSIGKLDDLQCAFASMKAFLNSDAKQSDSIPVHCVFDNEEVGSGTKQGAGSTFLFDTLYRVNEGLGRTGSQYRQALASSFLLSADNAHAVHPNHTNMSCPTNRPFLNQGIVLKYNANQKYTTDGIGAAVFKEICKKAGVPVQTFVNRSDMQGGSTLGSISCTRVAVNAVDIGLPQLAMHSPYETGGVKDTDYLIRAAEAFFCTSLEEDENGIRLIGKNIQI